jgi:DNA-binding IclR family transcriptional regulator
MENISRSMPEKAPTVSVAIDLLEHLQIRMAEAVGVSELARAIGTNKATCHAVLRQLQARGYVVQDEATRRYRIGPALFSLGMAVTRGIDLWALVNRHLEPLCHELRVTGAFSRHAGNGVTQMLGLVLPVQEVYHPSIEGAPVPFPSASIHALLAWADPALADRLYCAWTPPPDALPFLRDLESYRAELARIRARGYAESITHVPPGDIIGAVTSAAVFDVGGRAVFALTISDLTSAHAPRLRYYGPRLVPVAQAVTRAIGGRYPALAGERGAYDQAEPVAGLRELLAVEGG